MFEYREKQDTEAAAIMSSSFQTLKSTSAYHLGEWTKALSQGGSTPHSCYDASLYEGMDVKDSSFSGIQLLF
ncbi:hypothetical protein I79_022558 [Cricetulus griseus]|uniref:Uncharacterized protein n=1 Tax=Cricetulus griseus TaxID=10029 RepID=G3IFN5_CRIGR|nr:hypothetical protein I79_022558 [Cricetulus griseus]ERE71842.1 hypothetical protein H671_6g15457 [Cricetulus griseus]